MEVKVDKERGVTHANSLGSDECVKQVRFSPDGSAVGLVTSGPVVRLLNPVTGSESLSVNTGGDVFDLDFYPGFSHQIPASQSVLVASRNRPTRLFNTATGASVSAYTAYSQTEEIVHPLSVKFSPFCQTIAGGFPGSTVRVWDVQRPGRQITDLSFNTRKSANGALKGIVSAVAYCDESKIFAGTYSKQIALSDIRSSEAVRIGDAATALGGVIQLQWIESRSLLLSGHRMHTKLYGWDIRKPDSPILELPRITKTHQRFEFSVVNDQFVCSGDHYGDLTVFDLSNDGEIVYQSNISSEEPLVSVSVSPVSDLESAMASIVVGYGARKFAVEESSSSDEEGDIVMKRVGSVNAPTSGVAIYPIQFSSTS